MTNQQSPQAVEALPVVGYVPEHQLVGAWMYVCMMPRKVVADEVALTRHAPAQATIDRLTRALDEWKSRYAKAYDRAELATLRSHALDVDAVMALAYEMSESNRAALLAKLKGDRP